MNRISLCGVPVDIVSRSEALERCRMFLHNDTPHHIVTINPEFVVEAQKNAVFRDALKNSNLALCDGTGVQLAARWLCGARLERIPGVDFMVDLCELAEHKAASVFFLGGRNGTAKITAEVLQKRFPQLNIVGWSENIDTSTYRNTDILFVALGAPKQELWIARYKETLQARDVKIAMGVGGAFDLLSGKIKRAPQWLRELGFEWLWRFAREPWRLRRMLIAVALFPLCVLISGRQEERS